jgi:hypothetical protein
MKKTLAVLFFIAAAVSLHAQTLTWDIKFLKIAAAESVPVSEIIRMGTGEVFLITIKPVSDCFCYVVIYDSAREISVLHDRPLRGSETISIGPLALEDPPGTETFFVIMSVTRQTGLESLIRNHKSNLNSREHADNLRRGVVRLQNEVSGLGQPVSSFILTSGGTARGDEYVTRFSERDIYVRAIAIRH